VVIGGSGTSGPSLSSATPQALGVAAAGVSTDASRADHVHALPTIPALSSATPAALGVAAAGVSTDAARADHVHALPAGGVDTSLQLAPDTGWTAATGAGIGTAAIASGVATLTMTAAQTSARLRRTVPASPHMPAVEFVARVTQTIADGVHEQGIGLANASYTRGARVQVDIYGNVTILYNVAGSWVSGAFVNVGGAWTGGSLWLRMVATPLYIHFYHGSGAGPALPTSWTRVGTYDLSSAGAPDFSAPLGDGLTDLVLFAARAGGWVTNECTARNVQWRSLLGAPT
jgi:hypothetical protein